MKKLISVLVLLSVIQVNAQLGGGEYPLSNSEKQAKVKAFKIGYLTEKLSLTADEAAKFWPVYNAYHEEVVKLRKKAKNRREDFHRGPDLTDVELEEMVDQELALRQELIQLDQQFHVKVKRVLPIRKVFLLYQAERQFKKEMIKRIQMKRQGRNHRPMRPRRR